MIRKAVGMLIRSTAVAATTNRTSHRFAARKSTTGLPRTAITTMSPIVSTSRIGMIVKTIFPASVRRDQDLATAVTTPVLDGRSVRCRLRGLPHARSNALARLLAGAFGSARPCRAWSLIDSAHDGVEAGHH